MAKKSKPRAGKVKKAGTVDKTVALLKSKSKARRPSPSIEKTKVQLVKSEPPKAPVRKSSYGRQDLDHFKRIILEKKKEILEELETLRDSMMDATTGEYASENSMYSTHMEQGTDAMEREKTFLFASREGKFLNYLEDALQRIEKGDYGRCSVCGKLIEKERLEAVPHAQQCLQCKMHASK